MIHFSFHYFLSKCHILRSCWWKLKIDQWRMLDELRLSVYCSLVSFVNGFFLLHSISTMRRNIKKKTFRHWFDLKSKMLCISQLHTTFHQAICLTNQQNVGKLHLVSVWKNQKPTTELRVNKRRFQKKSLRVYMKQCDDEAAEHFQSFLMFRSGKKCFSSNFLLLNARYRNAYKSKHPDQTKYSPHSYWAHWTKRCVHV